MYYILYDFLQFHFSHFIFPVYAIFRRKKETWNFQIKKRDGERNKKILTFVICQKLQLKFSGK